MNAIITIHEASLPFMELAGPIWRKTCDQILVIANVGCPATYSWADQVSIWPRDPSHRGLEHCKRLFHGVEMASKLKGFTALSEADGLLAHDFNFQEGILYGSNVQSNLLYRKIIPDPYREQTLFCPWVTNQEGWISIAAVVRGWLARGWLPDEGYADRVISAAAIDCGLSLSSAGFNRWPKVLPEDRQGVSEMLKLRVSPLIHAIKDAEHLEWITNSLGEKSPEDRGSATE